MPSTSGEPARTVALDQQDRGSRVSLATGDTLDVLLPENATTGYLWAVAGVPDNVQLVDDELLPASVARPGAGGAHRYRFSVTGPPEGTLRLELRRPWEQTQQPSDEFEVHLGSS